MTPYESNSESEPRDEAPQSLGGAGPASSGEGPNPSDHGMNRRALIGLLTMTVISLGSGKLPQPKLDTNCGASHPSGGYYEDVDCQPSGPYEPPPDPPDNDCMLISPDGIRYDDSDCEPPGVPVQKKDIDCALLQWEGGPAHTDNDCDLSWIYDPSQAQDLDCGLVWGSNERYEDGDCGQILSPGMKMQDDDCAKTYSNTNPPKYSPDSRCGLAAPNSETYSDQDCGYLTVGGGYGGQKFNEDNDCSPASTDHDCGQSQGVIGAPEIAYEDNDCTSGGSDNDCTKQTSTEPGDTYEDNDQ